MKKEEIENSILKYSLAEASVSNGIIIYVSSKFHQTKLLAISPFYKPVGIIKVNARKGSKKQ